MTTSRFTQSLHRIRSSHTGVLIAAVVLALSMWAVAAGGPIPESETDQESVALGQLGAKLEVLLAQTNDAIAGQTEAGKELERRLQQQQKNAKGADGEAMRQARAAWAAERAAQGKAMGALTELRTALQQELRKVEGGQSAALPTKTVVIRTVSDLLRAEQEYLNTRAARAILPYDYYVEFTSAADVNDGQETDRFLYAPPATDPKVAVRLAMSRGAWIKDFRSNEVWEPVKRSVAGKDGVAVYMVVEPMFEVLYFPNAQVQDIRGNDMAVQTSGATLAQNPRPLDPKWKAQVVKAGTTSGADGGFRLYTASWTAKASVFSLPEPAMPSTQPVGSDMAARMFWIARGYEIGKRLDTAKAKYIAVASMYPDTEFAAMARAQLQQLQAEDEAREQKKQQRGGNRAGGEPNRSKPVPKPSSGKVR